MRQSLAFVVVAWVVSSAVAAKRDPDAPAVAACLAWEPKGLPPLSLEGLDVRDVERVAQEGLGETCAVFAEMRQEVARLSPASPKDLVEKMATVLPALRESILKEFNPRESDADAVCGTRLKTKPEGKLEEKALGGMAKSCALLDEARKDLTDPTLERDEVVDRITTRRFAASGVLKGEQSYRLSRKAVTMRKEISTLRKEATGLRDKAKKAPQK